MVTIDPNNPVSGIADLKTTVRKKGDNDNAFNDILQEAVGSSETKTVAIDQTAFLSSVRPAQFSAQAAPSAGMLVDQVEQLIDTMAVYQQKLVEEGATLKSIAPLVEKMEQQSKTLGELKDAATPQTDLKNVLDQSLALSSMEIARFKSGHYNE